MSNFKHGLSGTPIFTIWSAMKARCLNPAHRSYKYYGGRGITICPQWKHSLLQFSQDVGPRPSPLHSIDRIDNDGNYEPGNVRWATGEEQCSNRRTNIYFYALGEAKTISRWCRETGIASTTFRHRVAKGLPPELVLSRTDILTGEALQRRPKNIRIRAFGKDMTIQEWSVAMKIPLDTIYGRFKRNLSPEACLHVGHIKSDRTEVMQRAWVTRRRNSTPKGDIPCPISQ